MNQPQNRSCSCGLHAYSLHSERPAADARPESSCQNDSGLFRQNLLGLSKLGLQSGCHIFRKYRPLRRVDNKCPSWTRSCRRSEVRSGSYLVTFVDVLSVLVPHSGVQNSAHTASKQQVARTFFRLQGKYSFNSIKPFTFPNRSRLHMVRNDIKVNVAPSTAELAVL